jgi:hypothetical protein
MLPVQFWINPTPPTTSPTLTADGVEKAILAAAATWEAADPQINLVYQGRTTNVPGGFNGVIGFAPNGGQPGRTDGPSTSCTNCANPYYGGWDIVLDATSVWQWNSCDPAHGNPCVSKGSGLDVQDMATHEVGHFLGLGHAANPPHDDSQLTMYGADSCPTNAGCRNKDTLGLGDVIGVRALYPTSAPMPTLYDP